MSKKILETKNLNAFYGDFQALFDVSISLFEGEIISIIGSNRSGIFLHLMPIFSTVLAILIFKEEFMNFHLFGALFIIGGIFLSSK